MPGLISLEKVCLQKSVSLPVRGEKQTTILLLPRGVWKISKSVASVGERMLG